MRIGSITSLSVAAFLFFAAAGLASAAPVVDGNFTLADGYTQGYDLSLSVKGSTTTVTGGQLWTTVDSATGNLYVALIQPTSLTDNTYGNTAVGWSGGHKFSDLTGSDSAQFVFYNGNGTKVLDIAVDYFSQNGKNGPYDSLGVTGGDGKVNTGSASSVLAAETSLSYNFNVLGYSNFTTNSPATDASFSDPATAPGWVFNIIYEVEISASAFGTSGFGSVSLGLIHDSPTKVGGNDVTVASTTPILNSVPAPAAFTSGLALLLGIASTRRRRR